MLLWFPQRGVPGTGITPRHGVPKAPGTSRLGFPEDVPEGGMLHRDADC